MPSPDDRSDGIAAVAASFLALAIFSTGLRVYTRLRVVKWMGADDVLILCATGASVSEGVSLILSIKYGLGKHIEEQLPEWRKPYAISNLTSSLSYSVSAMFIKLSLLAFYLRLSRDRTFRTLTYAMMGFSGAFGIASVLAAGLQCIPVSMLWDPLQKGHCVNITNFYFANAGIHILTELLIYLLPIHTLWKLHLPLRQKLGLCGLMGVGLMLIVVSCYRIKIIKDLLASADTTWNVVTPLTWYTIELNLAIFIACGPAYLAFFRHYLPVVFGGSSNQSHHKQKDSYQIKSSSTTRSYKKGTSQKIGSTSIITSSKQVVTVSKYSREEMITRTEPGIKKQVDLWIHEEEGEAGYLDGKSSSSITPSIVNGVV